MKVTNSDTTALTGAAQQARQTAANSAASRSRTEAAGSTSDRVQLSRLSAHLRALSANSEARARHVGNLEAAVGAGHYRVDSTALSGTMIQQSMRGESAT